jgi:AcrR family transcriptional regulator
VPDRKTEILDAACRVIARRGVRGLRMEELAREAGVSVALIYYHFDDRENLIRRTLEYVDERAADYATPNSAHPGSPAKRLVAALVGEIQEDPRVRQNSAVWGEVRASAWFDETVREPVERLTGEWITWVADEIERGQRDGTITGDVDARAAAERLTALVEGVSGRWLAGSLSVERARALICGGVERELVTPSHPDASSP